MLVVVLAVFRGFIGLFLGPVLLAVGYSLAQEFTAGKAAPT